MAVVVEALSFGHLASPRRKSRGGGVFFLSRGRMAPEVPPARTEEGTTTSKWPAEKFESL
jgi:hypothetical protein